MHAAPLSRTEPRPFRHAIVAGGSIAGLLAARVLSERFDQVTVIERDAIEDRPDHRQGVPQSRHLHALLVRGLSIIEDLFPGITDELRGAGAALLDAGRDFAWYHSGGWRSRYEDDGLAFLSMSRPLLESKISARVRALKNVTFRTCTRAEGLLHAPLREGGTAVTGLRIRGVGGDAIETSIRADLVVDAMGRGSPIPRFLEEIGYPPPQTELLPARVAYATCVFEGSGTTADPRLLLVTGAPARRSGGIFPIEGGRRLMTLIGFFDERMPKTHEEFMAFARSLPVPSIWESVVDSKPLSEIATYRFVGSQRRFYERLRNHPAGLIAMGDAVCSFNPVYGQGMTVSAIQAEALAAALTGTQPANFGSDFVRHWFRRIAPIIDGAWNGVRLEDLRFPELADRRPASIRPLQWYMERVHRATHRSPMVTAQFYRVMNFLEPPTSLFRPRVVREVLFNRYRDGNRGSLARRRGIAATDAPLSRV
jgi:2-polyprenyl-6-methoxyphenol hydroxylase-like FAD-dependent oxidoreductase